MKVGFDWTPSVSEDLQDQIFVLNVVNPPGNAGTTETILIIETPGAEDLDGDGFIDHYSTNIPEGTSGTWFIRSIDDAGNVADMTPIQFEVLDTVAPFPATNPSWSVIGE